MTYYDVITCVSERSDQGTEPLNYLILLISLFKTNTVRCIL
jgi:hypothetical protein